MKKICTVIKAFINKYFLIVSNFFFIIPLQWYFVKTEKSGGKRRRKDTLLFLEGLAVGALIHSGICFVGTYQDFVQRAEIFTVTVVSALLNGTFDGFIGLAVHLTSSFYFEIRS